MTFESRSVGVSAVLIVKNEQHKIADCLASLTWADEVVVLDSGSTDDTCAIAQRLGARVEVNTDWQGFGIQRQRAEALAQGQWIFMIDADERVDAELRESIQAAVAGEPAVYEANRLCHCFGRTIRHSGMFPDWTPRLYPKGLAHYDDIRVHERLRNPQGLPERRLAGLLHHLVYDNLRHLLVKTAHYADEWATDRAARGKKGSLWAAVGHGWWRFFSMYILRRGFLDGGQGLLLALVMGHATFVKYADLWIRTRTPSPPDE
ncbi:MAG TPA: glycosyltransferase family 2 protein [Cellvibrionaceae bacterium]